LLSTIFPVGQCPSDDSDVWQLVEGDEILERGNYLLLFDESASKNPFYHHL
jgi:hypothetical protein